MTGERRKRLPDRVPGQPNVHAIIWCGTHKRQDPLDLIVSKNDIEQCVLAAHEIGVAERHVWALVCDPELLPQGFRGEQRPADVTSLRAVTRAISEREDVDGLMFLATNHGERDGLLTMTEEPDEFAPDPDDDEPHLLSPALLGECLDRVQCRQVVIVAACHAGVFTEIAADHRCVLCACGPGDVLRYHDSTDPARTEFMHEVLSHWSGTRIRGYEPPPRRDLRDAYEGARNSCPGCTSAGTLRWLADGLD